MYIYVNKILDKLNNSSWTRERVFMSVFAADISHHYNMRMTLALDQLEV